MTASSTAQVILKFGGELFQPSHPFCISTQVCRKDFQQPWLAWVSILEDVLSGMFDPGRPGSEAAKTLGQVGLTNQTRNNNLTVFLFFFVSLHVLSCTIAAYLGQFLGLEFSPLVGKDPV